MDFLKDLWERITELVSLHYFPLIVEAILLAVMIYFSLKITIKNKAHGFTALYIVFFILGFTLALADFISAEAFLIFVSILSFFVINVFKAEIRLSLNDSSMGKRFKIKYSSTKAHSNSEELVRKCIAEIIKAVQNMSKNNVGALIVLSNDNMPEQVLESGVYLHADISTQMVEGVFFPKAPMHDGAMIINGTCVEAAGCFLPISQNNNIPKDLGTRHRAAIGITQVVNVVVIIVSEETGIISIAKQGKIERYADYAALKKVLTNYYWKDIDG